jgi:hypothetical protein
LSELDIVTNESTIQFFSRGLYGVAKTIVEAYPIKRLSVVITFHEGAKIGFYNPANDGQCKRFCLCHLYALWRTF